MMLVNGAPAESIPVTDRGLAYGDGVFRTLRAANGRTLHWSRHYAKLQSDCAALGLPGPSEDLLLRDVASAVTGLAQAAVKIMVTRGSGPRGYATPQPCVPTRIVVGEAHAPSVRNESGISVCLCRLRLAHQPALAGIKHLNRLENVLARSEWSDAAIAEGLLLDQDDFIIGGTMSNLFIVEKGVLITPDLSRCGVAGVTRSRVIDRATTEGIAFQAAHLPLQRVLDADEAFLVNSLIGLWPISQLAARTWHPGALSQQVRAWLDAEDAAHH
ncbi:MAG: aminodeoxychorismate lyase [Burkholderiales bacterium]